MEDVRNGVYPMLEQSLCKERILSEEYRDFILGNKVPSAISMIDEVQLCRQELGYGYSCVYIESYLSDPLDLNAFYYNTIPKCYGLLDMEAMEDAGVSAIQNYPTLQLKGENVLIGFLDTGIDYTNEVFRDIGGRTRIEAIWDQSIQEGEPPSGFLYGTEYRRTQINAALQMEEPYNVVPSRDEDGHGTFVASVAAGGINMEEQFIGAAPEATIAMVKLKGAKSYLRDFYYVKEEVPCYQENDIMLAIRYLKQVADEINQPLVLCIALGNNMGSHTGISPLANTLNQYADVPQMAIVVGTGNEANERHHYQGKTDKSSSTQIIANGTTKTEETVEIRVGPEVKGFIIELWTEIPNLLNITVISPSGEELPPTPLRKGNSGEYFFLFEQTKIYIDYRLLMEKSNSELVFFRFTDPVEGIWKIRVEQIQFVTGVFHMWLTDSKFSTGEVYFLESEPDVTINEPGNAIYPMTVSYYDGAKNSIDIHSGRGYTRNNEIKPDFAAPGVNVKGALPRNRYTRRTGSSIATAITAGASALLMEWNVYQLGQSNISSIQIKNLLILGATRSSGMTFPNEKWGACVILVLG